MPHRRSAVQKLPPSQVPNAHGSGRWTARCQFCCQVRRLPHATRQVAGRGGVRSARTGFALRRLTSNPMALHIRRTSRCGPRAAPRGTSCDCHQSRPGQCRQSERGRPPVPHLEQLVDGELRGAPANPHQVLTINLARGVHQAMSELAVGREQQQPGCVDVQSPNGDPIAIAGLRKTLEDRGAPADRSSCHLADWLVIQQNLALGRPRRLRSSLRPSSSTSSVGLARSPSCATRPATVIRPVPNPLLDASGATRAPPRPTVSVVWSWMRATKEPVWLMLAYCGRPQRHLFAILSLT